MRSGKGAPSWCCLGQCLAQNSLLGGKVLKGATCDRTGFCLSMQSNFLLQQTKSNESILKSYEKVPLDYMDRLLMANALDKKGAKFIISQFQRNINPHLIVILFFNNQQVIFLVIADFFKYSI